MKVLQLITRLDKGGAPRVFLQLIRGLTELGIEIVMASGPSQQPEEDPEEFSQRLHIPYHPLPHLYRDIAPLHDLLSLFEIIALIRRERPTLLHTHTTKGGILGRIAGRMTRTKTIHTPHGHLFYGYFGKGKEGLYIFLERLAARLCERIITISEDERRAYLKKGIGDEHKVVTIYNGIDMDRFPGDGKKVRTELGIAQKTPLVGFVGRLEEIKGPDRFVEAAKHIKITSPQTHFVMVGDGPMKEELLKMAEGISDLHFVGYREDIPDLIAAFDIMLIPSLNDGFNLAAVEAMASAIPVVGTAVGGLPEVVGDGGILVNPGDTERMPQEAVTLLNSSRLRREMGAKGRKRTEDLFDWNVCLQRTIDLYREVCGETG
ncbi:MAG: glycosyltransferase family 4 protein [Deltaproteobacteria bacterium]|nr:glycosyltransferase family 4 protein [Deltaproteobacteria bacterium]